jgi:hypothetical protein
MIGAPFGILAIELIIEAAFEAFWAFATALMIEDAFLALAFNVTAALAHERIMPLMNTSFRTSVSVDILQNRLIFLLLCTPKLWEHGVRL